MKKLIEDLEWPTHCEHDVLHVVGITKEEVSEDFIWSDEDDGSWISFHFGRA